MRKPRFVMMVPFIGVGLALLMPPANAGHWEGPYYYTSGSTDWDDTDASHHQEWATDAAPSFSIVAEGWTDDRPAIAMAGSTSASWKWIQDYPYEPPPTTTVNVTISSSAFSSGGNETTHSVNNGAVSPEVVTYIYDPVDPDKAPDVTDEATGTQNVVCSVQDIPFIGYVITTGPYNLSASVTDSATEDYFMYLTAHLSFSAQIMN